jgi:DNA-binding HxlR family transcriptional regulator
MEDLDREMQTVDFELAGVDFLQCTAILASVRDAMYVLNGKWKIPVIIAMAQGSKRFGDIRRAVDKIAPKVLSKELKELELNGFLIRKVHHSHPVVVEYILTAYSTTLGPVLTELHKWGTMHRDKIKAQIREGKVSRPLEFTMA